MNVLFFGSLVVYFIAMALQFADRVQGFKLKPDTLKEF